jgi:hypothetical protein
MDAARRTRRLIGHSDQIKPTGMRFFKIPCRRQTFGRYSRGRGGLGQNDPSRIETALTIPAYLGAVSARTPFDPITHRA